MKAAVLYRLAISVRLASASNRTSCNIQPSFLFQVFPFGTVHQQKLFPWFCICGDLVSRPSNILRRRMSFCGRSWGILVICSQGNIGLYYNGWSYALGVIDCEKGVSCHKCRDSIVLGYVRACGFLRSPGPTFLPNRRMP